MWLTCEYRFDMSKMIQMRHVPDPLHRQLKARAAQEGLTLSDFMIREARKIVDTPTVAEIRERLARRSSVTPRVSPGEAVRRERDRR